LRAAGGLPDEAIAPAPAHPPARHSLHRPAVAPPSGRPQMAPAPSAGPSTHRRRTHSPDCATGHREHLVGISADPRRAAPPGAPGCRRDDPQHPACSPPPARATKSLWGARSLSGPVSCDDAPGAAAGHDDRPCPSVCSI
jgi:hypothetical protein